MEELESEEVEYKLAEEFLISLKKEFGGGEEELVKAAELKEQWKSSFKNLREWQEGVGMRGGHW